MGSTKQSGLAQTPEFAASFLAHILILLSPAFFPLRTTVFGMERHARGCEELLQ
jgi:hypothetical protein